MRFEPWAVRRTRELFRSTHDSGLVDAIALQGFMPYHFLTMSKVTSKFQISIPKAIVNEAGIRVGDELVWERAGADLRLRLASEPSRRLTTSERLALFDSARTRQKSRERKHVAKRALAPANERGWSREDLYDK